MYLMKPDLKTACRPIRTKNGRKIRKKYVKRGPHLYGHILFLRAPAAPYTAIILCDRFLLNRHGIQHYTIPKPYIWFWYLVTVPLLGRLFNQF